MSWSFINADRDIDYVMQVSHMSYIQEIKGKLENLMPSQSNYEGHKYVVTRSGSTNRASTLQKIDELKKLRSSLPLLPLYSSLLMKIDSALEDHENILKWQRT